jgi:hypothetical protein
MFLTVFYSHFTRSLKESMSRLSPVVYLLSAIYAIVLGVVNLWTLIGCVLLGIDAGCVSGIHTSMMNVKGRLLISLRR